MGFEVWRPFLDEKKTKKKQFGSFNVSCFDLTDLQGNWMHTNADGTECPCYGFLIEHSELGRMLYITDTEKIVEAEIANNANQIEFEEVVEPQTEQATPDFMKE